MDHRKGLRGLLASAPNFDSAAAVVASAIGKHEPRRAWLVLALASLTALFDRTAVVLIIDAAYGLHGPWWEDAGWILAALAGTVLFGFWTRVEGLSLAERASDTVLTASTRRLLQADWRNTGASAPGEAITRLAAGMRIDASQAAAALPALAAIPVTAAWLSINESNALLVVVVLVLAGLSLLRGETDRLRASETVLDTAESAFHRLLARLPGAGMPRAAFSAQALWPAIDDATRSASVLARANARVTAVSGWLAFLVIIVLLAFVPGSSEDSNWTRALLLVAATLHHVRHATAAYFAFERIGTASDRMNAIAGRYPVADAIVPAAPARWTSITFDQVSVKAWDTPEVFLAAAGLFDLELRRGEIVAVTGPGPDDRRTLLLLLCGLIQPDSGTVCLDGRPIPPAMLRGLCGGALDPDARPVLPPGAATASRARALLARFDLPDAGHAAGDADRTRLAIVAAELEDRPVRLYDERAAYLAPRFRDAFAETLLESRARGRTCVVCTNDPGLIAVADRVLRMEDGVIVSAGDAAR